MATSRLHSRGPRLGWNCYATPAFSGVPHAKRRKKITSGCATPTFLGTQKRAELLRNPCILRVPNAKRGEKIRSGCLTPTFSGAQKRAELLRNPCILGGPRRQARGGNHKWLPHPCLFGGPKKAGIAT